MEQPPLQHSVPAVQRVPESEQHLLFWQSPLQQSALAAHVPPVPTQQTAGYPAHCPLQQSVPVEQVALRALQHLPPEQLPPQHSLEPPQAAPLPLQHAPFLQESPEQHS